MAVFPPAFQHVAQPLHLGLAVAAAARVEHDVEVAVVGGGDCEGVGRRAEAFLEVVPLPEEEVMVTYNAVNRRVIDIARGVEGDDVMGGHQGAWLVGYVAEAEAHSHGRVGPLAAHELREAEVFLAGVDVGADIDTVFVAADGEQRGAAQVAHLERLADPLVGLGASRSHQSREVQFIARRQQHQRRQPEDSSFHHFFCNPRLKNNS